MEKITPIVDLAFKKIFGVEENKDLLMSLINATLSKEDQVLDITLLNPYNPKNFGKDKLSILDVKAVSEKGTRFNIEIQITDESDYDKRALYYWAKLYSEQLQKSQLYSSLNKAIGIHILNFVSIPDSNNYHNVFHITERETGMPYFTDLELHTIELTKFSKDPSETIETLVKKVQNSLDVWAAFLTQHDLLNKENLPKSLDSSELKKALHLLEIMNFTDEERMFYEDHLKFLRMEASAIAKAESKGRLEGESKGRLEGESKGRFEGELEGRSAVARLLLSEGLSIERVVQLTGLSKEHILVLK